MTLRDFVQETQNAGGFNVSPLAKGTKLFIETRNSFYEIEIVNAKEVTIFGGTRSDGTTRFVKPTPAIIHGSTFGGSTIRVDWIGQDMHLELREMITNKLLTTSSIKNVRIESPDGRWSYSMDW